MKVLQVNKFFYPRAGAETSFLQTRQLLREHGHEVVDFAMQDPQNLPSSTADHFTPPRDYGPGNPLPKRIVDAGASVYSRDARRRLRRLLRQERPDVAHLHNVYHQMTLSVIDELAAASVPIVMTVHDWKIVCPAYTLFTEGAPCRRCVGGSPWNAVQHRCVKESRAASAVAAVEAIVARRRGTYAKVDRFVAPSRFGREVVGMAGIDGDRIDVLPNFITAEQLTDEPVHDAGQVVLFAGRLDETKGLRQLLTAFARVTADVELRIAGAGPLEDEIRTAAAADPRIRFLGRLTHEDMLREFDRVRVVVLPSIWEDNGPYVILEAQARGRALIVTDRGGPPEFVDDGRSGLVVDPTDIDALAGAMTAVATDRTLARRLGETGRAGVERDHTATTHYEGLMTTYRKAMARR